MDRPTFIGAVRCCALALSLAVPLAACATNTPAQELAYASVRACRPRVFNAQKRVQPDGKYILNFDPGTPSEQPHFEECVRPYFAARALEGIAQPGPDAPTVQRQAYADLDECLKQAAWVEHHGPSALFVRPPVIRIIALSMDGTSR